MNWSKKQADFTGRWGLRWSVHWRTTTQKCRSTWIGITSRTWAAKKLTWLTFASMRIRSSRTCLIRTFSKPWMSWRGVRIRVNRLIAILSFSNWTKILILLYHSSKRRSRSKNSKTIYPTLQSWKKCYPSSSWGGHNLRYQTPNKLMRSLQGPTPGRTPSSEARLKFWSWATKTSQIMSYCGKCQSSAPSRTSKISKSGIIR